MPDFNQDPAKLVATGLTRQFDELCDRFEREWKTSTACLEDYLGGIPEVHRGSALRELLEVEIDVRRARGEVLAVEAYAKRFPDYADIIAEGFQRSDAKLANTIAHDSGQRCIGLHVRCPHCHNPIELVPDAPLDLVNCPSCGSNFSLTGGEQTTRDATTITRLGQFELIERLGMGAFGTVWKARDTQLHRTVAIKVPRKIELGPGETEKFFREARSAAQLRHPNIVSVHEVGRDGDSLYIVSDFIRGVPLSEMIANTRLTFRETAELLMKVADALHHAHEAGVVHRDLKPQNIMIDDAGEPHLMDFGLAKREAGEITMTLDGAVLGTPAYMSPEQARGESHSVERTTDIYSLGVILFQMLTGELPFRGTARMLMHQVIRDEPPSPRKLNSIVPKDLETIALKCMEKEPRRRFQSAIEVGEEIRRHLRGEAIHARPIGSIARGVRWCRRNPTVSLLAAALFVAVILGVGLTSMTAIRANRRATEAIESERHARNMSIRAAGVLREATSVIGDLVGRTGLAELDRQDLMGDRGFSPWRKHQAADQLGSVKSFFDSALEAWDREDTYEYRIALAEISLHRSIFPDTSRFEHRSLGMSMDELKRQSDRLDKSIEICLSLLDQYPKGPPRPMLAGTPPEKILTDAATKGAWLSIARKEYVQAMYYYRILKERHLQIDIAFVEPLARTGDLTASLELLGDLFRKEKDEILKPRSDSETDSVRTELDRVKQLKRLAGTLDVYQKLYGELGAIEQSRATGQMKESLMSTSHGQLAVLMANVPYDQELERLSGLLWKNKLEEMGSDESRTILSKWDKMSAGMLSSLPATRVAGLKFRGAGYVMIPSLFFVGASYGTDWNSFTIEAIVRCDRSDSVESMSLVSAAERGAAGLEVFQTHWALSLFTKNESTNFQSKFVRTISTSIAKSDEWQHVAGIWNGKSIQIYVDGQRKHTVMGVDRCEGNSPSPFLVGADPVGPGRSGIAEGFFTGTIKAVRISCKAEYETPFTPPKELSAMDATVCLLDFTQNTGEYAVDQSGQGNHGILCGDCAWDDD